MTASSFLATDNWIKTIQRHFADNFSYSGASVAISYGTKVVMDDYEAGISVYPAEFSDPVGYIRMQFRVVTRNAEAEDSDMTHLRRICDAIRAIWRATPVLTLKNFNAVSDPGDTPVNLDTVLLIISDDKRQQGEAASVVGPVEDGEFWRTDLFYKFILRENLKRINHMNIS